MLFVVKKLNPQQLIPDPQLRLLQSLSATATIELRKHLVGSQRHDQL